MISLDCFSNMVWKNNQNAAYAETGAAMSARVLRHPKTVALRSSNHPIHLSFENWTCKLHLMPVIKPLSASPLPNRIDIKIRLSIPEILAQVRCQHVHLLLAHLLDLLSCSTGSYKYIRVLLIWSSHHCRTWMFMHNVSFHIKLINREKIYVVLEFISYTRCCHRGIAITLETLLQSTKSLDYTW